MQTATKIVLGIIGILALYQLVTLVQSAYNAPTANSSGGQIYSYENLNIMPAYWQNAMTYLNQNVCVGSNSLYANLNGTYTPNSFVLSWWDYGDWLNWFGNCSSVLRGDNQVDALDYQTAYTFVDGNVTQLAQFMKQENAGYLMFSSDDFQKWSALNYLACIYQNQTSVTQTVGASYCENQNDPTYLLAPTQPSLLSYYCTGDNNSTDVFLKAVSTQSVAYCLGTEVPTGSIQPQIDGQIYDSNETLLPDLNLVPISQESISGTQYNVYLLLYEPLNTGSVSQTCTYPQVVPKFYQSNFYCLYFIGMAGNQFTQIYPSVNAFGNVRIWKLNQTYVPTNSLPANTITVVPNIPATVVNNSSG